MTDYIIFGHPVNILVAVFTTPYNLTKDLLILLNIRVVNLYRLMVTSNYMK